MSCDQTPPGAAASVTPSRVATALCAMLVMLLLGHAWSLVMIHVYGRDQVLSLVPLLHFDREQNLPTFAAVLLLLGNSCLLALNRSASSSPQQSGWGLLSIAFAFLALDEFASLHERLDGMMRLFLMDGAEHHGVWVLPYAAVGLAFAATGFGWWRRLDARTRWLSAAAGGLYVGGALGMEAAASLLAMTGEPVTAGEASLAADLLVTIEETAELGGAALFLWTLVDRLARCGSGAIVFANCVTPFASPSSQSAANPAFEPEK